MLGVDPDLLRTYNRMRQDAQRSQAPRNAPWETEVREFSVRDDPAEAAERRRIADIHIRLLTRFAALAATKE